MTITIEIPESKEDVYNLKDIGLPDCSLVISNNDSNLKTRDTIFPITIDYLQQIEPEVQNNITYYVLVSNEYCAVLPLTEEQYHIIYDIVKGYKNE